tara:strand:- start:154 stop:465 length:312 start_codon:yes stop_codon:yes gene_type:complete
MKITEKRLRRIIKKVINESSPDLPTNFQRAYDQGRVDQNTFYSTGPTSKHFPGYHFTEELEADVRAISSISEVSIKQAAIDAWCLAHDLNRASFDYICKEIGC